jgi:hypothetical protein
MDSTSGLPSNSIIHKVYALYVLFYKYNKLFPKRDRFVLSVRIEESILEVLELFLLAQTKEKSSKLLILNKADLRLKTARLLVRIAYEIKAIDQKKYLALEEKLLEIGKMLGGWIKSTNTKEH